MVARRKLEIQVNKPVKFQLLYNDCVKGTNAYGEYFLYAVKTPDGSEYAFFPPREVHESLKGLEAGDTAVVTKLAATRNGRTVAKYDVAVNGRSTVKAEAATQQKNEASSIKEKVTPDNYYELMLKSLEDGVALSSEISGLSLDHIIRISITLFIQRTKSNNGFNH